MLTQTAFDLKFMQQAIEKSVPEDGRPHPKVGVIVTKGGKILATAYRGELARGDRD